MLGAPDDPDAGLPLEPTDESVVLTEGLVFVCVDEGDMPLLMLED